MVVTDGRDNASVSDLQAAIRRVQTTDGPVIYSIGLLYDVPGTDARRARHDLQALSDETGGIAFFPAIGQRGRSTSLPKLQGIYAINIHDRLSASGRLLRARPITTSQLRHWLRLMESSLCARARDMYVRYCSQFGTSVTIELSSSCLATNLRKLRALCTNPLEPLSAAASRLSLPCLH